MKFKELFLDGVVSFVIVFVVSAAVTFLWNLIFRNDGHVDWYTTIILATLCAVYFPWSRARSVKKKQSS